MKFKVRLTGRAKRNVNGILAYLAERSFDAACRLEKAFEEAIQRLEDAPLAQSLAPEDDMSAAGVRQIFFKTRRGKLHRALFVIEGEFVWIIHVRGPGQNILGDIVPPPETGRDES